MKRQDSSGQERRDGYNPVAQHAGLLSEVNSLSSFSPLPGLAAWLFNSYRTTRSAPQSFSSAWGIVFCSLQRVAQTFVTILSSDSAHRISSDFNCSRKSSCPFQSVRTVCFCVSPPLLWLAGIHDCNDCCLKLASCL